MYAAASSLLGIFFKACFFICGAGHAKCSERYSTDGVQLGIKTACGNPIPDADGCNI
jgi:hypothetical protein